jgi:hypothetical protein
MRTPFVVLPCELRSVLRLATHVECGVRSRGSRESCQHHIAVLFGCHPYDVFRCRFGSSGAAYNEAKANGCEDECCPSVIFHGEVVF